MRYVFFDLETSDKNFIGQILNFAFVATDRFLQTRRELKGLISLSRLQLPLPESILVNRVNIEQHQQEAKLNEAQAMRQIHQFISEELSTAQQEQDKLMLVGYSSNRFDLAFLRTSMIRNGINPYFSGKLLYRDLLHLVRFAYLTNQRFPGPQSNKPNDGKTLSLSLENVARELGLLDKQQAHNSYDDVLLCLRLAKKLESDFALNLSQFEPYQAGICESAQNRDKIFRQHSINYDLQNSQRYISTPVCLHDFTWKEALWIDLERYKSGLGVKSIFWLNKNTSAFFLGAELKPQESELELAKQARNEFLKISLTNYFKPSQCDIEQDIYRVDFDAQAALEQAIWQGNSSALSKLKSRDAKVLYKRFRMANYAWGGSEDERMQKMLLEYGLYRYGGKIKMQKQESKENDSTNSLQHPTLSQMFLQLSELEKSANSEDLSLLKALKSHYQNSDIYRFCASELGI